MEKIKMTKRDIWRIAGGRPVLSADYSISCLLQEKGFQAIGYNDGDFGWNFDVFEIGKAVVCAGHRPMKGSAKITAKITRGDHERSAAEAVEKMAESIKVTEGYKKWGWLAAEVFGAMLQGKESFSSIFRPYHAYKGNFARLSYSSIPEGLDEACDRLGIAYEKGNDAPRGGKAGDFLRFFKKEGSAK